MKVRMGRWVLGTCLVAVLAIGAACAGSDESGGGGGGSMERLVGPRDAVDGAAGLEADTGSAGGGGGGEDFVAPSDLPAVGPSIIKTAQVSLEVPSGDFRSAMQDITATAGRFGGFIVSTSTSDDESRRGAIVLRVPSEDFENALASIQDLGKVESENVSGEDVSQEFVDLEARLRNLQAQESVLLGLMKEAQTIPASIRVQNSLSSVQLDIEQIHGRINFLEDRASMSTIAVDVTEHGAPVPKEPGVLSKAWSHAVNVIEAIVYAVIVSLGFILPIGLMAGLVYLAVRLGMRTLRPRFSSEGTE
jgi:hypothetical protein